MENVQQGLFSSLRLIDVLIMSHSSMAAIHEMVFYTNDVFMRKVFAAKGIQLKFYICTNTIIDSSVPDWVTVLLTDHVSFPGRISDCVEHLETGGAVLVLQDDFTLVGRVNLAWLGILAGMVLDSHAPFDLAYLFRLGWRPNYVVYPSFKCDSHDKSLLWADGCIAPGISKAGHFDYLPTLWNTNYLHKLSKSLFEVCFQDDRKSKPVEWELSLNAGCHKNLKVHLPTQERIILVHQNYSTAIDSGFVDDKNRIFGNTIWLHPLRQPAFPSFNLIVFGIYTAGDHSCCVAQAFNITFRNGTGSCNVISTMHNATGVNPNLLHPDMRQLLWDETLKKCTRQK